MRPGIHRVLGMVLVSGLVSATIILGPVETRADTRVAPGANASTLAAATTPDLVPASVSGVPASVQQGARLNVLVTVRNAGSRRAGPSTARFYLSRDAAHGSYDLRLGGSLRVPALDPGRAHVGRPSLVAPVALPTTTFHLLACVDDTRRVDETNERNNCRAASGTVRVRRAVTSYELIDGAVAAGEIGAGTGLLYKVYRDFDDRRLPARFRGNDAGMAGASSLDGAAAVWDTLPPRIQRALAPFFVPPIYRESWFFDQQTRAQSALSTPASIEDPRPDLCTLARAWRSFPSANGKVRVWYQRRYGPSEQLRAEALAGVIDHQIWPKLTRLMGRSPLPDGGSTKPCRGGDNRLDILLLDMTDEGRTTSHEDCPRTPAYISLDRSTGAATAAHELMHAIQFAFNSCDVWLMEATATWAEDYVFHRIQSEQDSAWDFLTDPRISLESEEGNHEYGAYLLPFFLAGRNRTNAVVVRKIWQNAGTRSSLDAINAAVPGGFARWWKKFVLYNWNSRPVAYYRAWDELFQGALPDGQAVKQIALGPRAQKTVPIRAGVEHLAASYISYEFNRDVRLVEFHNSLARHPDADVQAIIHLADGTSRVEDWSARQKRTFCRDKRAENVTNLVVIVSNHSRSAVLPDAAGRLVVKKSCTVPPNGYHVTFSGFSVVGDTWTGQATFDLIGPAQSCTDPSIPPTADDLVYCYELVEGTVDWRYEASRVTVDLTPATDVGGITLVIRNPRPDRVRSYHAGLNPKFGAHCIPGDSGCRDAQNFVIAWIATAEASGGFRYIGNTWQLVGSVELCAPEDPSACQGWTWNFQPI